MASKYPHAGNIKYTWMQFPHLTVIFFCYMPIVCDLAYVIETYIVTEKTHVHIHKHIPTYTVYTYVSHICPTRSRCLIQEIYWRKGEGGRKSLSITEQVWLLWSRKWRKHWVGRASDHSWGLRNSLPEQWGVLKQVAWEQNLLLSRSRLTLEPLPSSVTVWQQHPTPRSLGVRPLWSEPQAHSLLCSPQRFSSERSEWHNPWLPQHMYSFPHNTPPHTHFCPNQKTLR